jgi:anti-sigma factor RsiW
MLRLSRMEPNEHKQYVSLMSLCLDGVASREERLQLAGHLGSCPTCAATWERWQEVDRLLSATPAADPPLTLMEGVLARLHPSPPPESRWGWLTVGVMVVGTISLGTSCLAVAWLLWWGWRHPLELVTVLSAGAQMLSALSWLLVGIESSMASIGGLGFVALLASSIIGAGGLVILWIHEVVRTGHSRSLTPLAPPRTARISR